MEMKWTASRAPGCPDAAEERTIALLGNPNVGKSTLFNALTGLRQHTGNWPGKTVELARGTFSYKAERYTLVDLPGTYSLHNHSEEERVTTEFLRSGAAACVLVVVDATNLERSLLLALEVLERETRVIVCVNLLDEARRDGLQVDLHRLEAELGVPVVGVSAARREGLARLQELLRSVCDGFLCPHPRRLGLHGAEQTVVRKLFARCAQITERCVQLPNRIAERTRRIDRIVVGKGSGLLLLAGLLFAVLWLTISGANLVSGWLEAGVEAAYTALDALWWKLGWNEWLGGILIEGAFATTGKVVAVMLPPVMVIFPLFALLEDAGYLPRVAYLLDGAFCRAGCCGKQALTMCMGLGCNAAGVTGARIIASPRERLLAILTNSFVPCNGRFPMLIVLSGVLFSGRGGNLEAAICLTLVILLCVWMTLTVSAVLSRTILRGTPSAFVMELPPYRGVRFGAVLLRAMRDRVLFVLARAAAVAAPAGALIWALARIQTGGGTLLQSLARWLDPLGSWLGMDGAILLAFLLGWPANELVIPLLVMILQPGAALLTAGGGDLAGMFSAAGGEVCRALCVMCFCLFHWPCSTTVLTIRKETGSWRWTALAVALPTFVGMLLCRMIVCLAH